jgi:hypothetical protein
MDRILFSIFGVPETSTEAAEEKRDEVTEAGHGSFGN